MGLDLPRTDGETGRGALAQWVRNTAEAAGRSDLARRAALITVRAIPNLGNWIRAEQMAPSAQWSPVRDELLAELRQVNNASPYGRSELTPIFLHEHQIDDALHSIKGYATAALLAQVADAALEERPNAVLTMSKREAEAIMDEGKSGYYDTARDWLRRYKIALSNLDRADEWVPYRNALLEKHRRRYKLIPLIRNSVKLLSIPGEIYKCGNQFPVCKPLSRMGRSLTARTAAAVPATKSRGRCMSSPAAGPAPCCRQNIADGKFEAHVTRCVLTSGRNP
jgi:hypothetical protein